MLGDGRISLMTMLPTMTDDVAGDWISALVGIGVAIGVVVAAVEV